MASAPNTDAAASLPGDAGFFASRLRLLGRQIDAFLEAERQQLPLWAVVAFGGGIAMWFALPSAAAWGGFILVALGLAAGGFAGAGRLGRAMAWAGAMLAIGCALVWARSAWVETVRVERPTIATFNAEIERVEPLVARERVRLTLRPEDAELPPRLRVTLREAQRIDGLKPGARIGIRARLVPPPGQAVPGGYDFSRDAWFKRIGGVGNILGDIELVEESGSRSLDGVRARLGKQVREGLPGRGDGIATALATGDKNAVSEEDADAMRRSGLAHLLAVSGLHIAAVVGTAMFVALKLLALFPALARRYNLILWSAAVGAGAGIGYTLLTGMQVPTVRAAIAALLVLLGLALGRAALSLRLVAVGAAVILLVRPEAIAGASFQLSFAAVTAIIALHAHPRIKGWLMPRDDGIAGRIWRGFLALLLTGLAVEITLMPLALYHFHKAGLYGVLANLVAIPMTTFLIIPSLALALIFDSIGLGAPFWWLTGQALDLLTGLAHAVGDAEGAVAMVPTMPTWAFASTVIGGVWLFLWTRSIRWFGLLPIAIGLGAAAMAPRPDMLVTGDGKHVAILDEDGVPHLLRSRVGDFIRDVLAESAGYDGDPASLDEQQFARCNRDACLARIERNGRHWDVLMTRSRDFMRWSDLVAACATADIVIADRRLPDACAPRWLKLDRAALEQTGGLSLYFGANPRVATVRQDVAGHPWGVPVR